MAIQYPTALDNFVNPNATDTLNSVTVPHHQQHTDLNDAVEAIQTVMGINPAASHLTVKDRMIAIESNVSIQSVLNGLTDVTINSVGTGDVLQFNGSVWVNATKQNLVDGGNF
jgi:hypothetical protein